MTRAKHIPRERVLEMLLGPAAPELTCEECFERLDEYVEHTLADGRADEHVPGMRAHLEGCPACEEDYRSLLELVAREEGRHS